MSHRVLITGANKGIGRALVVDVLSHRDDTHVVLGSRDEGRGRAARDELIADHPDWADRLDLLVLDVASEASVAQAAEQTRQRYGATGLHALVNNAGVGPFGHSYDEVLDINAEGAHRTSHAFLPQLVDGGRIVNMSSGSAPNFVAACAPAVQQRLTDPAVTWADVRELMATGRSLAQSEGDFASAGLTPDAYGLSKAALNALTIELARTQPHLLVNACSPGFIETDLTRKIADARGSSPEAMGMKPVQAATRAPMFLLFGDVPASGWYFGSDAERSPLDRYRSPGDPPYTGE